MGVGIQKLGRLEDLRGSGCTFLWEGSCRAGTWEGCSAGEGRKSHHRKKQSGQRVVPDALGRNIAMSYSTIGNRRKGTGPGPRQPGERGRVTEQRPNLGTQAHTVVTYSSIQRLRSTNPSAVACTAMQVIQQVFTESLHCSKRCSMPQELHGRQGRHGYWGTGLVEEMDDT